MSTPAGARALRADARADRGRILDVAEEGFGQGGDSASTAAPLEAVLEVYALLVGIARATARANLDEDAKVRLLAIIFDGLAPRVVVKHLFEWISCHPAKPPGLLPGPPSSSSATAVVKAASGRGGA